MAKNLPDTIRGFIANSPDGQVLNSAGGQLGFRGGLMTLLSGPSEAFNGIGPYLRECEWPRQAELEISQDRESLDLVVIEGGIETRRPLANLPKKIRKDPHFPAWLKAANVALRNQQSSAA